MGAKTNQGRKMLTIDYAIIQQDESGNNVMFRIPLVGLYYMTHLTGGKGEIKIENKIADLCDKAYARQDEDERVIWDDEDRKVWVKKVV